MMLARFRKLNECWRKPAMLKRNGKRGHASRSDSRKRDTSKKNCTFKIATLGNSGYVEVYGPGNMNITPVLKDICYAMMDEQKTMILVDLKTCDIVDSTFMGTLVGIQERMTAVWGIEGKLLIINPSDEHLRLFDMVGISHMIHTVPDIIDVPDFALTGIPVGKVDREEKLRVIVEAHEKLIQLNDINKDKFEKFLGVIKEEMNQDGIKLRGDTKDEHSNESSIITVDIKSDEDDSESTESRE